MRWAIFALAFIGAGCGKSFQEADAIYKDEVAKLDALKREGAAAAMKASLEAREIAYVKVREFDDGLQGAIDRRKAAMRPVGKDFISKKRKEVAQKRAKAEREFESKLDQISDAKTPAASELDAKLEFVSDPFEFFELDDELDFIAKKREWKEVDAIYADDTAGFSEQDKKSAAEFNAAHKELAKLLFETAERTEKLPPDDRLKLEQESRLAGDNAANEAHDRYAPLIADQEAKVKAAYKAKEAAK